MKAFSLQPLASRLLLVAFLALAAAPSGEAAYDLAALEKVEKDVQAVAEHATPCIVAITHPEKRALASGSGCVIAPNGLILTAAHVVGDAKMVNVVFTDRKLVHARVLGADYHRDVALAMITEPGDYPFMELGDTKKLAIGEMVVALGHPGGFDPQRKPPVRFGRVFEFNHDRYIRTDCTLAGGDSGGPLFDLSGHVVGVHSSVGADLSVNNDVPVEAVRADWDRLMRGDRWGQNDGPLGPKLAKSELNGLDQEAFRELVLRETIKSKGGMALTPERITKWLVQCGMKAEKAKELRPADLADFVAKVFGGSRVDGPKDPSPPPFKEEELAGLDLEKFRTRLVASALQSGGRLQTNPEQIAAWLRECGMKEERVKMLGVKQVGDLLEKALGFEMVEADSQPEAIIEQDKEVFEAVKPGIDKIAPSMVALMDGDKTLALGTIVRENGFILTKHTEIAKAKALKVRLPDGRTLPAREVQEFAGHDLALVKTRAEGLPAISILGRPEAIHLGSLVFSPGASGGESVVGQGIVSLLDRSLNESGGYLGIAMNEVEDAIKVTEVLPASPAGKAGLRKSDRIIAVNDTPLRRTQEFSDYIRKQTPDSIVRVKVRRGTEEKIIGVTLGDRAKLAARPRPEDPMSALGTEVSARHTGFPLVFQHDQPLRPSDCGGVVINIHGEVVGVNVARANRVETYAVPASAVAGLLKGVDFRALAHEP